MSRTVLAGIITATLMAVPAATATAEQMAEPVHQKVDITGIDFTTHEGARTVLDRIERAADRVCGVQSGRKSLDRLRVEMECVNDAIDNAIESIATTNEKRAALTTARKG